MNLIMSKIITLISITTGSLIVFADLPLFFLFGVVFVGIMIEIKKIEIKAYPIISNVILSAFVGWAVSFGVKHKYPEWFEGDVRIFSMFIITLFAYAIAIYLLKNETVQKIIEKYLKKKSGYEDDNTTNNNS